MKIKLLIFLITICCSASFGQSEHGAKLKAKKKSLSANKLESKMAGKDKINARITGVVEDVCHSKGCWMKVTTDEGKTMRVTFKDYGFFVPMDITGKRVTFEGTAYKKETSVADLKHYVKMQEKQPQKLPKLQNLKMQLLLLQKE